MALSKIDLAKVWTALNTALVVGYVCYLSRRLWKRKLYWVIVVTWLLTHVAILILVQRAYPHLSLFYYIFFGSIEMTAMYMLLVTVLE